MQRTILSSTSRRLLAPTTSSASRVAAPSRSVLSSSTASRSHTTATATNKLSLAQQRWGVANQKLQQSNKSTLALNATSASRSSTTRKPQLSREQMSSLFLGAAIPMVGFGFMDNFIMITAGSAIDNTLGVQFGLATMTAAAIGQVVSDVSGVVFGDTMAKVFKVAPAKLTEAQKQLAVVGRIKLAGAVLGIVAGCTLGAVALWMIPEGREGEASESISQATTSSPQAVSLERTKDQLDRLQKVMADFMTSQDEPWHDRRASCTLYVNESMGDALPKATLSRQDSRSFFEFRSQRAPATIKALNNTQNDPEVQHAIKEGRVVVFANTIYVPVMGDEETKVLGIFKIKLDNGSFYNGSEIKDAKKVARNVGFFLNHMV